MTILLEPQELAPAGVSAPALTIRSLLGSFQRSLPAEVDPVHTIVRRCRAGEPEAVEAVLQAGRIAIEREAGLRTRTIAAVVVPGHDGVAQPGLIHLVATLAEHAGWTVPTSDVLARRWPVPEAKRREARDPVAEAASLAAECGGAAARGWRRSCSWTTCTHRAPRRGVRGRAASRWLGWRHCGARGGGSR